MLFDTHAHYDDDQFDPDREALLASLPERGVGLVVNPGCTVASSRTAVELAHRFPHIYAAVGIHPENCGDFRPEHLTEIRALAQEDKVVAIGEIGLDYYWDKEHHDIQKKWFIRQMDLAKETKLPIIVHSRDAAKDTLDLMKAERADNLKGVIHCYSYSVEQAKEYMNMGYYLGVGGVVTFKNGKRLKDVVAYAPLEYLLLETDAPYLAPEPYRRHRNCSAYLTYVAEEIAAIKGVSYETVVDVTRENAGKLFGI